MQRWISAVVVLILASRAQAEVGRTQVQADLGLAVVAAAVELPIGERAAVQLEAGIFGTYFLPWFGLGDDFVGFGGGVRFTWFSHAESRGYYFAPFVRVDRVGDPDDNTGTGFSAGAFVGRVFRPSRKIDVRVGAGLQYMHYDAGPSEAKTPFVALDAVVGYRL
jgi:hypothetical protein